MNKKYKDLQKDIFILNREFQKYIYKDPRGN